MEGWNGRGIKDRREGVRWGGLVRVGNEAKPISYSLYIRSDLFFFFIPQKKYIGRRRAELHLSNVRRALLCVVCMYLCYVYVCKYYYYYYKEER